VGFKGPDLAVLEIVDSFGQRSVMTFAGLRINTQVETAVFQFKPPVGADLIQQ
jgi:outer membrane lipoprotein carrier protein